MQRNVDVTTSIDQTTDFELPQIPVPRKDFVQYVGKQNTLQFKRFLTRTKFSRVSSARGLLYTLSNLLFRRDSQRQFGSNLWFFMTFSALGQESSTMISLISSRLCLSSPVRGSPVELQSIIVELLKDFPRACYVEKPTG